MVAYTYDMNQTLTYWAPGAMGADGRRGFAAPVTVICRWQAKTDLVRNRDGNEVVSSAVAYPAQELLVDGWAVLGDQTATSDPRSLPGAYKIIAVGSSPDLDEDEELWKAWL